MALVNATIMVKRGDELVRGEFQAMYGGGNIHIIDGIATGHIYKEFVAEAWAIGVIGSQGQSIIDPDLTEIKVYKNGFMEVILRVSEPDMAKK